jgi:glycosyltransferase involved in cell wall biosynthesis
LNSASSHEKKTTVVIVGPPWPKSGTSRVIQNQIEFYRSRGFFTVFVAVAIQGNYFRDGKAWDAFKEHAHELDADHVAIAALNRKLHTVTKVTGTIRHALRGTKLNWIFDTGKSAQLQAHEIQFIRDRHVALIHVNHVFTLGFALRMRKQWVRGGEQVPMIVETHDVQSHLINENGNRNPWTRRPDSLSKLERSETKLLGKANVLVHLSVDDFTFFKAQMPDKQHLLSFPTINESFVSDVKSAAATSSDAIDLLFVGQYSKPNFAAIEWFLREVWPLIANKKYKLTIVGAVEGVVRATAPQLYEEFRSAFLGPIADLAPYYHSARCVIAPMVYGSGISIKTIEALALGKPFVGTSKAFRGMPMKRIEQAGLRAHDDPKKFAEAIVHALSSEQLEGTRSRAAYDEIFSLQSAFASRDEALRVATSV